MLDQNCTTLISQTRFLNKDQVESKKNEKEQDNELKWKFKQINDEWNARKSLHWYAMT